ncbi:MAG: alpha-2-macroglobulin, partial [Pirellulales bacterium]
NFKEAYDGLRRLVVAPNGNNATIDQDLSTAVQCLRQLNRVDEVDALLEQTAAAHSKSWQALAAVANEYSGIEHYGYLIGGEFHRGQHRGGGRIVHATARDRVRALQLYRRAVEIAAAVPNKPEAAAVLRGLAQALAYNGDTSQYWRLQSLTDLATLPDYEEGWGYNYSGLQGAPVGADGKPVFYEGPANWDSAKNDGERWRWALATMVDWNPKSRADALITRAAFLAAQFDVQTMAGQPIPFFRDSAGDAAEAAPTWALDTLTEDETIARLATGIQRFKLPDDQNYIKLYQQVLALQPPPDEQQARTALTELGTIFENRRQFDRAAEYWRLAIERFTLDERKQYQNRLDQIIGNWGEFGSSLTQAAGRGATIDFRFRNAKEVEFTAQPIDVEKLLADVRTYLNSQPKQLDGDKLNIA